MWIRIMARLRVACTLLTLLAGASANSFCEGIDVTDGSNMYGCCAGHWYCDDNPTYTHSTGITTYECDGQSTTWNPDASSSNRGKCGQCPAGKHQPNTPCDSSSYSSSNRQCAGPSSCLT